MKRSAIGWRTSDPGNVTLVHLTGDLLIRDATSEVAFEVTATMIDHSTIEVSVATTVLRSDYWIGIPTLPVWPITGTRC